MAKAGVRMTLGEDPAGRLLRAQLDRCGPVGRPTAAQLRAWAALGCLVEQQGWRLATNRFGVYAISPTPTEDRGG